MSASIQSSPFQWHHRAFFWRSHETMVWMVCVLWTLLNRGKEDNHVSYALWRELGNTFLLFFSLIVSIAAAICLILSRAPGSCLLEPFWMKQSEAEVVVCVLHTAQCHLCFTHPRCCGPLFSQHYISCGFDNTVFFLLFGWIVLCPGWGEGDNSLKGGQPPSFVSSSHSAKENLWRVFIQWGKHVMLCILA